MGPTAAERYTTRIKLRGQRQVDGLISTQFQTEAVKCFALPVGVLLGPGRHFQAAFPRALMMWVYRHDLKWSFPRIGREFKRDHSTVLVAVRKVDAWIAEPRPEVAHYLERLRAILLEIKENTMTRSVAKPLGTPSSTPRCSFCGLVPEPSVNIVQSDSTDRPAAICETCLMTVLDAISREGT